MLPSLYLPKTQVQLLKSLESAPNKTRDPIIHCTPSAEIPMIWISVRAGVAVFMQYMILHRYLVLSGVQCKNDLCLFCATMWLFF